MRILCEITFIFLILLVMGCSNASKSISDTNSNICPDDWDFQNTFNSADIKEKIVNDTIKQQIISDKVWFEIINERDYGKETIAYLKFYRTNGTLEEEGLGSYNEHPVVDFVKQGEWKYYTCDGKLSKKMNHKSILK